MRLSLKECKFIFFKRHFHCQHCRRRCVRSLINQININTQCKLKGGLTSRGLNCGGGGGGYRWQFMVLLWKIPIKSMQAARIFTHLPAWKQKLSLQSGLALGASIIPVSSVSWCKVWKTQSGFNFLAGNPAL